MDNLSVKDVTMTLNDLALLLTVLDKEAFVASYYERLRKEGEYVERVRFLQRVMFSYVSDSKKMDFVESNPHLRFLLDTDFSHDGNSHELDDDSTDSYSSLSGNDY